MIIFFPPLTFPQLYKPYTDTRFLDIIRGEVHTYGIPHMILSGLPTVIAYHVSDYVGFFAETILDTVLDEEGDTLSSAELYLKRKLQLMFVLQPRSP